MGGNRGWKYKRTSYKGLYDSDDYVNPEKVFADEWENECKPNSGYDFGFGLVQNLFIENKGGSIMDRFNQYAIVVLNNRERMIVSTVIQWLGSNVGHSFLVGCLEKSGYRVERIEK